MREQTYLHEQHSLARRTYEVAVIARADRNYVASARYVVPTAINNSQYSQRCHFVAVYAGNKKKEFTI